MHYNLSAVCRRFAIALYKSTIKSRIIAESAGFAGGLRRSSAAELFLCGGKPFSGYVFPRSRASSFLKNAAELRRTEVEMFRENRNGYVLEKMCIHILQDFLRGSL